MGVHDQLPRGRYTVNVEPAPGWLETSTYPPCALTMDIPQTEPLHKMVRANGFQGCPVSGGQLRLLKNTIWYMYGCLHLADHIIIYSEMSWCLAMERTQSQSVDTLHNPVQFKVVAQIQIDFCSWLC